MKVSSLNKFRFKIILQLFFLAPDTQTEHCDHPEYGTLLSCIHHELFKTCIMAKPDAICQKIKNFIKKCPSRKDELFDTK